jgi:hypothetical protein
MQLGDRSEKTGGRPRRARTWMGVDDRDGRVPLSEAPRGRQSYRAAADDRYVGVSILMSDGFLPTRALPRSGLVKGREHWLASQPGCPELP